MIGVDTNVLLRPLLEDDAGMAALARNFLEARSADDPAYVSLVVLVELAWNLRRIGKWPHGEIRRAISELLNDDSIVVEADQAVVHALVDAEETGADLADALIAHLGIDHGCDYSVTFDRRATRLPGMLRLDAALSR